MKKLFIASLIALISVTSAFASYNEKASSKAAAHLEANYPTAQNISWSYGETFQKASITLGNEKAEVYYDQYGGLIGLVKTMAFDKLPKAALETLTTDYTFPEYQLKECIAFTDADEHTSYYVSFTGEEGTIMLSIAADGKVTPIQ